MKLQFDRSAVPCLDTVLEEVCNQEQTQELRLPEGMPDVGRVLAAWGQGIVRSKEWRTGEVSLSAGMLVWVLYAPEDGSNVRCVDSWVPFQMKWDLPEGMPEGIVRFRLLPRFTDARAVSSRKLMLRCGLAALAEAFVPVEAELRVPAEAPEGVELLRSRYPLRLRKEAGEKQFLLDEDLTLPPSVPAAEKLLYCTMEPQITEQRVLANKAVLKGIGVLHVLYLSEEGQVHGWDFELPFSQLAELEGSYSPDAQAEILPAVTSLEADLDEEGHLRLKCAMVAQYVVDDVQMVETVEEAYAPGRTMETEREMLELPAILETRRELVNGEQSANVNGDLVVDARFQPEFPRQRRTEKGLTLAMPGMWTLLYMDENGCLQGASARWEGEMILNADENISVKAVPLSGGQAQAILAGDGMRLRAEVPMAVTAENRTRIPMVTGLEIGEPVQPDPERPSLILRRAGEQRLWDMAKDSGSTVAAIRRANDLEGEAVPGQLLLIPIP